MMKKLCAEEICSQNPAKSSVQRAIRAQILTQYPRLEEVADDLLPRKNPFTLVKCQNHITLLVVGKNILFFQVRDGPWIPSLRLLHKYPSMMPKAQVDRGAMKHVLRGASIMCPGLHPPAGRMEECIKAGDVVQVLAPGKLNACAIGVATLSPAQIREQSKGVGIESYTYLDDGLWRMPTID